jgi:hypothetical protein
MKLQIFCIVEDEPVLHLLRFLYFFCLIVDGLIGVFTLGIVYTDFAHVCLSKLALEKYKHQYPKPIFEKEFRLGN